eukprot:TCALIF_10907-PA protein Name:"Protein of unknown function" AED:0.12 eAED:0.12 QI:0/0.57/0.25/0.87/0.57/0.5/8/0/764
MIKHWGPYQATSARSQTQCSIRGCSASIDMDKILTLCLGVTCVQSFPKLINKYEDEMAVRQSLEPSVSPSSLDSIVSLLDLESEVPKDGETEVSKEEYERLTQKYGAEYFRLMPITNPTDKRFGFYRQLEQTNEKDVALFSKYNMPYVAINFMDETVIKIEGHVHVVLQAEIQYFAQIMQALSVGSLDALEVIPEHLNFIVNGALTTERSLDFDKFHQIKSKEIAGAYIWKKLGSLGFVCGMQSFKPKQFLHTYRSDEDQVLGTNMFSIIPGEHFGTKEDKILVVGAHWDTVDGSSGFDDNASGVAAVLELGRALSMAECSLKYTVILVTFDLEEHGTQGSLAFVQDFLVNMILKPMGFPGFQGAIILDSIMSFNTTIDSQILPPDYEYGAPEAFADITNEGRKGDFIGLYSRDYDSQLSNRFQHHWHLQTKSGWEMFKIKEFRLKTLSTQKPDPLIFANMTNFLRSDHVRFWYGDNEAFYTSFKSVMISDSGPSRGNMASCYHQECDSSLFNKTVPMTNLQFLEKVVQTLIDTVVDASQAECKSDRFIVPFESEPDGSYVYEDKFNDQNSLPMVQNQNSKGEVKGTSSTNEATVMKIPTTENVKIEDRVPGASKADTDMQRPNSFMSGRDQYSSKRPSTWESSTEPKQEAPLFPSHSEPTKVTLKDETRISEGLSSNSLLDNKQSFEETAERRNFPEDLLALKNAHTQMQNMKVRPLPGSEPYLGPNQSPKQGGIPRVQGYIRNKKAYYANPKPTSNGYIRYL